MSDDDLRKLTPADWLAAADPYPLLDLLRARTRNRVDVRRLRLYTCVCCREVWHLLPDDRSRHAIEAAERYADGLATEEELAAARSAASAAARAQRKDPFKDAGWAAANPATHDTAIWMASTSVSGSVAAALAKEASKKASDREAHRTASHARHAAVVHDLFGNPFEPLSLDSAYRSPALVSLAQAAYDDRSDPAGHLNPSRLHALADALEDAGAPSGVVEHLRGSGPHVRGCWAVDAVLGRDVSLPVGEAEKLPVVEATPPPAEFAPLRLVEASPDSFNLVLTEFDRWAATFEELGREGGGYGWHGVADALLRQKAPKLRSRVRFDPEGSMFVASGTDRAALGRLARLMLEAMGDPAVLKEAIAKANPKLMG